MRTLVPALVFLILVGIIFPSTIYGLEENGVIEIPFTENPPVIDGKWTTPEEWMDTGVISFQTDSGRAFYILTQNDPENIFVMIDMPDIQTPLTNRFVHGQDSLLAPLTEKNEVVMFQVGVCFDTNENTINDLERDDYCFAGYRDKDNNSKLKVVQGDGQGKLISIPVPTGSKFEDGFSSANDPYESGRDHQIFEFSIPISFLHRSDSYGFRIWSILTANTGGLVLDCISWPDKSPEKDCPQEAFYNMVISSSWATLTSLEQKITSPPIPVLSISSKSISFGNVEISEKNSKSISISNKGNGILKIKDLRTTGQFSFEGIEPPIELGPDESVSFRILFSPLGLGEKSGSLKILSDDISNPEFSVALAGSGVEKGTSPLSGGGCLIATASYGSELAPQVQMLREIRDNVVLITESGTSFMNGFNQFYYFFSPTIADWERQNPMFKETVKITITPLLYSLSILNYVDIDSEGEILVYGMGVILLNVGMYFVGPIVLFSFMKGWFSKKCKSRL